jgi:hypothetical protein
MFRRRRALFVFKMVEVGQQGDNPEKAAYYTDGKQR